MIGLFIGLSVFRKPFFGVMYRVELKPQVRGLLRKTAGAPLSQNSAMPRKYCHAGIYFF